MATLFEPIVIGSLELKNRFVCSATYEAMAGADGGVTADILSRYDRLARGGIGLITPGHMYVHPRGRAMGLQIGIHNDAMLPGLADLAGSVHRHGARVVFQLAHAGRQAPRQVTGAAPLAPTGRGLDPVSLNRPQKMSESDITDTIKSFALISMSRPFVREPSLVEKFREGKSEEASCISCNMCFAAVFNNLPLRCYRRGLPG